MPQVKLTPAEAKAVRQRRTKVKAYNAVLYAVVDRIKVRLKKSTDPIEVAIVSGILDDVRKMCK